MPRRPPRVHIDGVPLHIVQRGHNRQPCFFAEEDYHTYLHWLGEALHKKQCLAKRAKDIASAAVLLSLLNVVSVWALILLG